MTAASQRRYLAETKDKIERYDQFLMRNKIELDSTEYQ